MCAVLKHSQFHVDVYNLDIAILSYTVRFACGRNILTVGVLCSLQKFRRETADMTFLSELCV